MFVYKHAIKNEGVTKNVKEWLGISQREGNSSIIGDEMGVWE